LAAITREERLGVVKTRPVPIEADEPAARPLTADDAARRALAWLQREMPDSDIAYDDLAPRQSEADLSNFRPASFRHRKS